MESKRLSFPFPISNKTVFEGFAQNDLWHEDPQGADHPKYTKGLNLALHNYLNRTGFAEEIQH